MQAPLQGRCAAMLFFKHRLAVLPAMPAAGDAFEDMLARELAADSSAAAGPSSLKAGAAAAVLGNSYVEDLSKLGIGEVLFMVAAVVCTWALPRLAELSEACRLCNYWCRMCAAKWGVPHEQRKAFQSRAGQETSDNSACSPKFVVSSMHPTRQCTVGCLTIMVLARWQVRDAVFLHGYNEPTLLLLHETEATWSGFACERKDT